MDLNIYDRNGNKLWLIIHSMGDEYKEHIHF